jgi:hypothetical protein
MNGWARRPHAVPTFEEAGVYAALGIHPTERHR